jgi:hypothetical protein
MTRALVMVTNPRTIPECIQSFKDLTTDVGWVSGFTQSGVMAPMAQLIEDTDYDVYLSCADDCIVSQEAVDAVVALLDAGHPVATGWCRLDRTHEYVNLTTEPIRGDRPTVNAYSWWRYDDVMAWPDEEVPTHFMGMSLTAMPRELWQRYPYRVFGHDGPGYSSDFNLSMRLRNDGVPMIAAKSGFVDHVKETWNHGDKDPAKRLRIGEMPAGVTLDVRS